MKLVPGWKGGIFNRLILPIGNLNIGIVYSGRLISNFSKFMPLDDLLSNALHKGVQYHISVTSLLLSSDKQKNFTSYS